MSIRDHILIREIGVGYGMGYNIALCETECKAAPCREMKLHLTRIMTGDKFVDLQVCDEIVSIEDAKKAVGDWDAFLSRNRLPADVKSVYMSKVKKESDIAALTPYVKRVPTGWVNLDEIDESMRGEVIANGDMFNSITAWQDADFDTCTNMCQNCPLAWNKGRNCMETFGPSNTKLPAIAEKAGCPIIAGVPKYAEEMKKFTSADAASLLKEVEVMRPALEADGKLAVHRYAGVLDRLEAMAKACVANDCGFYFF